MTKLLRVVACLVECIDDYKCKTQHTSLIMMQLYALSILLAKMFLFTMVKGDDDWVNTGFTCASLETLKESTSSDYDLRDKDTISKLEIDGCCNGDSQNVCSFSG